MKKRNMKKSLIAVLILMLVLVTAVACAPTNEPPETEGETTISEETTIGGAHTEATSDTEKETETEAEVETDAITEPDTDAGSSSETESITEPETDPAPEVDPAAPVDIVDAEELSVNAANGNQMAAEKITEYGFSFVRLTTDGADPYFYAVAPGQKQVLPQYMAIRYRTNSATGGQFFVGSGDGPSGNGDSFNITWNGNGQWNLMVVDLMTTGISSLSDGIINYVRLDFFIDAGSEGDYFDVEYVAFFNTAEYASEYDIQTHKYPLYVYVADECGVVNVSFDELDIVVDDTVVADVFAPGASAGWDHVATLTKEVDSLRFWGWTSVKGELGQFGYQIDGGTPIFDDAFAVAPEAGLEAAVGVGTTCDAASRMAVYIDVSTLEGRHTVAPLYKNSAGVIVAMEEFVVVKPESAKDIENTFVSDIATQTEGTAIDQTDLKNYFTMNMPTGQSLVVAHGDGLAYNMSAINEMLANVNGKYFIQANNVFSDGDGWMFVRGYQVVNSDAIIEAFDPNAGLYKINNFYETDGQGGAGGAGIYARVNNGVLEIRIKVYNSEATTRVGNKQYSIPVSGTELTMADNGDIVSIYVDGYQYATIELKETVTYPDIKIENASPKNTFAGKAIVTLANGAVETLTNTLVADSCDCQIGVVARAGNFKFTSIEVNAYSKLQTADSGYPAWDADKNIVAHLSFDELKTQVNGVDKDGIFTPGWAHTWNNIAEVSHSVDSLKFWGWAGVKGEIGQFGFQIGNNAPVFDAIFAVEAESGLLDVALGMPGVENASRMAVIVPVSQITEDTDVQILYKNADGEIVLLHKFQVRISAYVFPEEPVTPTESLYGKYSARGDLVAGHSFDELDTRTGSDKVGAIFSPGGSAFWNRNANVVPPVDTLRYWGWISVIGEFGELGYQFDGEDAVFDASFAVAAEDGLGAAVGVGVVCDAVSRVEVLVPVGELSGTNHVDILYKAPDGTIVSLFKFVINIGE